MSDTETIERPAKSKAKPPAPTIAPLHVERDALLGAVRTVGQVVEARNTIPILSNVLLAADAGVLRISGTDLNMMATIEVPCDFDGSFATTVREDVLKSAIDTLRPGRIDIELADGGARLVLSQGRATRRLPTLPAADFPPLSLSEAEAEFEMPAAALLDLVGPPSVTMSNEEKTRIYLCGVFLHVDDGRCVTADATDGYGLVRVVMPIPAGAADLPDVIISRKTVSLLKRLLDGAEGQVRFRAEPKKISVSIGRTTLTAKTIEGTFPNVGRTIPTSNDKVLKVHSAELRRCIAAAASLAETRGSARGVTLDLSSDGCQARSMSADGAVLDPLDADYAAEPLEIGLNSRLALPIVSVFGDAAQMEVRLNDAGTPALFTSPDKPAITAVLMTMRM